jgi:5-methylcytosine-specific restriction endonuclease McrA
MYIENKYYKWYRNIIKNAKNRNTNDYTEQHHIIPRSLGGSNDKDNLVALTAKEHFICHILLTKFTKGSAYYKMIYACNGMQRSRDYQNRYINSRLFETIKKNFAKEHSKKLKDRKLSKEHREAISKGGKGRVDSAETIEKRANSNRGKKRTAEQRERMRQAQLSRASKTAEEKAEQIKKAAPKISEKLKGKEKSKEHREKISNSLKGVTKGIPKSEETKQKMRKPKSEAHRKAISEARKLKYAKIKSEKS